jgi:hypothetical protein
MSRLSTFGLMFTARTSYSDREYDKGAGAIKIPTGNFDFKITGCDLEKAGH